MLLQLFCCDLSKLPEPGRASHPMRHCRSGHPPAYRWPARFDDASRRVLIQFEDVSSRHKKPMKIVSVELNLLSGHQNLAEFLQALDSGRFRLSHECNVNCGR